MEPAIVSGIIKADRLRKTSPKVGEMVRFKDHKGLFMVMRVDEDQRMADLTQRVVFREVLEKNIPFKLIRAVSRETSRTIQKFLHS